MTAGCVVDIDVAVSVFIIFQKLLCKSLRVVSKVLVLVAPVFFNITAVWSHGGIFLRLSQSNRLFIKLIKLLECRTILLSLLE